MSKNPPIYLTSEGAARIQQELEELKGPRRMAMAKRLRDAIQMGDLSENADYHKAKEDQAFLEGRIQELDFIMTNAIVVDSNSIPKDVVSVGSRVTVQEQGLDPEVFQMVGAQEADPRAGKISHESPIGAALMDHRVGDVVEAETPGGRIQFTIMTIE
jgi:transcription elongation factor GreA